MGASLRQREDRSSFGAPPGDELSVHTGATRGLPCSFRAQSCAQVARSLLGYREALDAAGPRFPTRRWSTCQIPWIGVFQPAHAQDARARAAAHTRSSRLARGCCRAPCMSLARPGWRSRVISRSSASARNETLDLMYPPLTALRYNFERSAEAAVSLMMDRVHGGTDGDAREVMVPWDLIIGQTCAPARNPAGKAEPAGKRTRRTSYSPRLSRPISFADVAFQHLARPNCGVADPRPRCSLAPSCRQAARGKVPSAASLSNTAPGFSSTMAFTASPQTGSGTPTTAQSPMARYRPEHLLDFARGDVESARDDDVLQPVERCSSSRPGRYSQRPPVCSQPWRSASAVFSGSR